MHYNQNSTKPLEYPLHDIALSYATHGWHVIPLWWRGSTPDGSLLCTCPDGTHCTRPGQHPIDEYELTTASTDAFTIETWWSKYPQASVGIVQDAHLIIIDPEPWHDPPLHLFYGSTDSTPKVTLSLSTALHSITDDTYKSDIDTLRLTLRDQGKTIYDSHKRRLDAFTFTGTFAPTRAKAHLQTHSGIVHADIDGLSDVQAMKDTLCQDPFITYCFISPSGRGLKVGIRVTPVADDQAYKYAWQTIADYHQARYSLIWDPSGKDISRLCYVSHDPTLYYNPSAFVFPLLPPHVQPPAGPPPTPMQAPSISPDRRARYGQQAIANAVSVIDASTPGNRHDARLRASNLLGGYVGGGILSYQEAYAALEDAVTRNTTDFERSMRTIVDGLAEGQKTPISEADCEAAYQAWLAQQPHFTAGSGAAQASGIVWGSQQPVGGEIPPSDVRNAQEFVDQYGIDLRYVHLWKAWHVWTGTHWQKDSQEQVMQRARRTILAMLAEARLCQDKRLAAHAIKSLSHLKLMSLLAQARSFSGIPVAPEALDKSDWLLPCANGYLDLTTGQLKPHDRADLVTHCLASPYDATARCPVWQAFLWRVMGGSGAWSDPGATQAALNDADNQATELIVFLQRVIGYALTGSVREQKLFILYGVGSNGKSTFLDALQALLGKYAQSTESKTFMAKEKDGINNDLARMKGARLVTAIELGQGRQIDEELVKRATGGDMITARFLYSEYFDYRPQFKLFLATNHKPVIRGTDHAIWRRLRLIPFTVTIPDAEQDKHLAEKLQAELPGILAWAVRGCLDWQRDGLSEPAAVTDATQAYRDEMNTLGQFIAEECLLGDAYRVRSGDLYEKYKNWCDTTGQHRDSSRAFSIALASAYPDLQKQRNNGIWWLGIGLPQP